MKKTWMERLALAILVIGVVLATRFLWPKTIEVVQRPRIVTVYDTVAVLDTAWITRTRREVRHDTIFAERVTVTPPETLYVLHPMLGITFLHTGRAVGDSTLVSGFSIAPDSTGMTEWWRWQAQYWTAGPLHTIDTDSFPPRISFYPPNQYRTGKECGFWCKLGYFGLGNATGVAVGGLACAVVR